MDIDRRAFGVAVANPVLRRRKILARAIGHKGFKKTVRVELLRGNCRRRVVKHHACFGRPGEEETNGAAALRRMRPEKREGIGVLPAEKRFHLDRKSTRLNSSHSQISYAVFCLK